MEEVAPDAPFLLAIALLNSSDMSLFVVGDETDDFLRVTVESALVSWALLRRRLRVTRELPPGFLVATLVDVVLATAGLAPAAPFLLAIALPNSSDTSLPVVGGVVGDLLVASGFPSNVPFLLAIALPNSSDISLFEDGDVGGDFFTVTAGTERLRMCNLKFKRIYLKGFCAGFKAIKEAGGSAFLSFGPLSTSFST